jgi:hypothetical protein
VGRKNGESIEEDSKGEGNLDHWISVFRTAPIDFYRTIRGNQRTRPY